ncbi:hypothetical protein RHSIM_Rhsim01G0110700 [Rhododendron simsii]|uniref:CCHC-type domain-containing protein n=1 Tax=Rhododendron simsii TaxID=118357 RepID=A0A834HI52_RHOSS|nr:hypothetical protein RHSIM_Rhsim01G0110700 [Rhododendron simsii]
MADAEILDLEEGSGETGEIRNHWLVGRILSPKALNPLAVSNVFTSVWKTRASFSVVPWQNNTFLFRFEDGEDRDSILQEGPWSIMNNLLILNPLQEGGAISDMEFEYCPFWIQVHGLPLEKMTRANAEIIGRRFGELLAVETSMDGMLLGRSFLRVRVAVKITDPLSKGFWLRRKPESNGDMWISYKYEKLSDYCYDCGRIGHDNRSCKFVNREEGMNSGYGPELRTGRVRRSQIPIEIIRQEVDEAEIRVNQLLSRRPKIMSKNTGACTENLLGERVAIPNPNLNHPQPEGVTATHSSDHVGVLQLPGGNMPKMTGNSPPLSSLGAQEISISIPRTHGDLIRNDGVNWTLLPKMHDSPENSSSFNPSLPTNKAHAYFVTKPDSPKSSTSDIITHTSQHPIHDSITPSSPTHMPTSNSTPSNPTDIIPSPSKPNQTHYLDVSLANVFKSLAIKRKACDDVDSSGKSKIIRLCNPEQPLNPTQKTKTSRTPRKPYRGGRSSGSARNSIGGHEIAQVVDADLCDVSVQQQFGNLDGESDLVPIEVVMEEFGAQKGLVAGPKQPPSQC